ncbi:hypothetical protein [Streptomyces dubilierae]|uniref:Uncharacterized protein n=1 Tax=Streptomyces dubilierae TaxID=3075533 RepID=A0ABU2P1F1_9ACTN|nr:hypothetical protein [Streptomyces sp. DSM 41921]MDT0385958.1 hypothetical protein [Streptomyces sp. DSM 41921]
MDATSPIVTSTLYGDGTASTWLGPLTTPDAPVTLNEPPPSPAATGTVK